MLKKIEENYPQFGTNFWGGTPKTTMVSALQTSSKTSKTLQIGLITAVLVAE